MALSRCGGCAHLVPRAAVRARAPCLRQAAARRAAPQPRPQRCVRRRASEPPREDAPAAAPPPEAPADDAQDVPGLPRKVRGSGATRRPLHLTLTLAPLPPLPPQRLSRKADSTDPISTFLTRRFGLAGGLAWLGVLTFGVVSEQLKTRGEVARELSGTQAVAGGVEVASPSGLRYTDTTRGGGETAPQRGYLLAADVRVTLGDAPDGPVLFDTAATGRPLAFFFGCAPGAPWLQRHAPTRNARAAPVPCAALARTAHLTRAAPCVCAQRAAVPGRAVPGRGGGHRGHARGRHAPHGGSA
jgi:hypothetical protein